MLRIGLEHASSRARDRASSRVRTSASSRDDSCMPQFWQSLYLIPIVLTFMSNLGSVAVHLDCKQSYTHLIFHYAKTALTSSHYKVHTSIGASGTCFSVTLISIELHLRH
jgi:hypothetical protein